MSENSRLISHLSIGVTNYSTAIKFYDKVLATLGCKRIMEFEDAIGYGKQHPEFWVQTPINGKVATVGNGSHIGFVAQSKSVVDAFFETALAAGATSAGEPGPRSEYGEPYYGCFVYDVDGHKIEALYWDEALATRLLDPT